MTFDKYLLRSPFEVIFAACASLLSWAGLQKLSDVDLLKEGAKKLVANAQELMRRMGEGAMSVSVPVNTMGSARLTDA